eukprot:9469588-Pyramimonas_sp.AAC.2
MVYLRAPACRQTSVRTNQTQEARVYSHRRVYSIRRGFTLLHRCSAGAGAVGQPGAGPLRPLQRGGLQGPRRGADADGRRAAGAPPPAGARGPRALLRAARRLQHGERPHVPPRGAAPPPAGAPS